MSKNSVPDKWQSSAKALKAVQVAFDLDEQLQYTIRLEALKAGLSPSDMIRDILDLPVNRKPKRPRLTVSLTPDDYVELGKKYDIDADEQLEIKRKVMETLVSFIQHHQE